MILVLADDMTGALEVGAVFAESGFRALVTTRPRPDLTADVLVVDTETRHLTSQAAFEQIVSVVRATGKPPDLIYKKTDSTLRGNIRAELNALTILFPEWHIGYAPAYPEQGRTVTDGLVYVHGVPLSETSFAQDSLNPVLTSSVQELIGDQPRCTIFDGTTNADVAKAAEAILANTRMRIAVGPAALASALAKRLPCTDASRRSLPRVQSCVIMNGSRTAVSQSQLTHAQQHGCAAGGWTIADPGIPEGTGAAEVAALRAEHLLSCLQRHPADAVLIIGGDTAHAFVHTLGDPAIFPIAELVPGVPISHLKAHERKLVLITKAGGFGAVDVLCRIRQILEQNGR